MRQPHGSPTQIVAEIPCEEEGGPVSTPLVDVYGFVNQKGRSFTGDDTIERRCRCEDNPRKGHGIDPTPPDSSEPVGNRPNDHRCIFLALDLNTAAPERSFET